MQYICNFLSKRAIPLIVQHLPEESRPLITVENWNTWEEDGLYLVYGDGLVEQLLDEKFINRQYWSLAEIYKKDNTPVFKNNCWNPDFIIDLSDEIAYDIDEVTLDIIYGRWQRRLL